MVLSQIVSSAKTNKRSRLIFLNLNQLIDKPNIKHCQFDDSNIPEPSHLTASETLGFSTGTINIHVASPAEIVNEK